MSITHSTEPRATETQVDRLAVVLSRIAGRAAEYDRSGDFPAENFVDLHDAGLLALTAPVAKGGAGATLEEAIDVVTAVAEADPATALILAMQYLNLAALPKAPWPDTLKERIFADATERGSLINALYVEPELGTPIRGGLPATTATRTENGWSITGRKIFSTGSHGLSWLLVLARTDESDPRGGMFLVPNPHAGISIIDTWDHLGMRATASHDLVFENVEVPFEHALNLQAPGGGKEPDPVDRNWGALLVSAVYQGVALAARGWIIHFLQNRKPSNLGQALATVPRMQEAIGRIDQLLTVNRRLFQSAARDVAAEYPASVVETGLLKVAITENAIAAVEEAIKLSGNPGISRHNDLQRHLRNVLCARIHTPQADSAHIGSGKRSLECK